MVANTDAKYEVGSKAGVETIGREIWSVSILSTVKPVSLYWLVMQWVTRCL